MQKDNNFHKIGLFGTTIKDASDKIKSLKDIIQWLEDMDSLYTNGSKKHWWGTEKSTEKGMKCLHDSIQKNKLDDVKENSFSSLIDLVVILQDISIGSKKAWRGRTKQPGFQSTLKSCQKFIVPIFQDFLMVDETIKDIIGDNKKYSYLLQKQIEEYLEKIFGLANMRQDKQDIIKNIFDFITVDCNKLSENDEKTNRILTVEKVNKIANDCAEKFKLEKKQVENFKEVLLSTNTNFKFLYLNDKFSTDITLENIILWILKLHEKIDAILKQVEQMKKKGDFPNQCFNKFTQDLFHNVEQYQYIKRKLQYINTINSEFNKANKKSYLKYLWSVHAILKDLEDSKLESTKELLDFTSQELKKIWKTIIGETQNVLSKNIISVICYKLNIKTSGYPTEHFKYEDLVTTNEKEFTTEMKKKLEVNKALLKMDKLSQALIKRFNENYDNTSLIDISGYIKNS